MERRKARKAALEILFQRELTGQKLGEIFQTRELALGEETTSFTLELVRGVIANQAEIDALIRSHTDNWALERMPVTDRTIIRIGIYEMLHEPGIPYSVSINEAVELAKLYGTQDSGKFVNGILGKIAAELKEEEPKEGQGLAGGADKS